MKFLIVGQGIAGTVLAWTLLRKGARVQVADSGFPHQSSGVAAGIINPVTGKRYVKTWRLDDFFPVAQRVYQVMEAELGCRIWQQRPILRLLSSPQEINDWALRMAAPDYTQLIGERSTAGDWAPFLKPGFHVGEIRQAARVDFSVLLAAFSQKLEHEGHLLHEHVTPEIAAQMADQFDHIIFCEGYRAQENPYFPGLPWQLSKGEGLIIRIADPRAATLQEMVKRELILVPLGNNLFWVGASYNWTFEDDGPSKSEQDYLLERLTAMITAPFEIIRRFGAIRPTVKDRRPFLGVSPVHPKMVMFNGLGTKGALLAPYWAEHLTKHVLEGQTLDPEVDIQRFRSKNL